MKLFKKEVQQEELTTIESLLDNFQTGEVKVLEEKQTLLVTGGDKVWIDLDDDE